MHIEAHVYSTSWSSRVNTTNTYKVYLRLLLVVMMSQVTKSTQLPTINSGALPINMPQILHRRVLHTIMLLVTVAIQLATFTVTDGLQAIEHQQQIMISTMKPLLQDHKQQQPVLSETNQEPATNKTGQTSDTTETTTLIRQAVESDIKRPITLPLLVQAGISNELKLDQARDLDTSPSIITKTEQSADGNDLDSFNSFISRFQTHSVKSRRHAALFNPPVADWWTKLSPAKQLPVASKGGADHQAKDVFTTTTNEISKQKRPESVAIKHSSNSNNGGSATKTGFPVSEVVDSANITPKPHAVYKEQALNQNAIITIKNQLSAIKGKRKLLITKSMQQLQQLDNRLIESYKLCLKKKMPLYAGMLYRTRDFVSRMAKEANHERKVLEAMTKQVHTVLRQKMTNRTLVREYNRLVMAPTTEAPIDVLALQRQQQADKTDHLQIGTQSVKSSYSPQQQQRTSVEDSTVSQSPNLEDFTSQSNTDSQLPSQQDSKNELAAFANANEVGRLPNDRREKFSAAGKKSPTKVDLNSKISEQDSKFVQDRELERLPTKAKQSKYTVSVNEVNLKKELTKIQSLIDRINGSCYEITSVVDDIIYLFRLSSSSGDAPVRNGKPTSSWGRFQSQAGQTPESQALMYSANSDPKQVRKMLRSPLKVFLEKYGRLSNLKSMNNDGGFNGTSSSSNSDFTNIYPQEIKPLFEPSSLVYSELKDPDIGFD